MFLAAKRVCIIALFKIDLIVFAAFWCAAAIVTLTNRVIARRRTLI